MITEQQLATLLEDAYNAESGTVVEPAEARHRIAIKQASAIAQFVIGRQTTVSVNVNGTTSNGGSFAVNAQGTGIIN